MLMRRTHHAATALALMGAAALAGGCGDHDDEHLFNGELSPTQLEQQPRSAPVMDVSPADTDSEDPFIDNPSYPFTEEPSGMGF